MAPPPPPANRTRRPLLLLNHVSFRGGAEESLLDIVRCLPPERYAVHAALPGPGPLAEALAELGVELHMLPMQRLLRSWNPPLLLRIAVGARRVARHLDGLIRKHRIRLLHANSNTAQIYAGPAARRAAVPSLWHSRDLTELGPLGPWLGRRCTCAAAVSQTVRCHLQSYVRPPERVRLLYNGIAPPSRVPAGAGAALRRELGLGPDHFVVAMVGHFVPWKRHDLFIQAAARIAARERRTRFLVVGADLFGDQPRYEMALRRQARAALPAGYLHFTGYRSDMPAVYAAVDLLVHPARREPFGRAVAEAMAAGKPVAAARDAGPAEIVRHGVDGLLVEPGNAEALAEAVLALARDRSLARGMGRTGRRRIAESFGLDRLRSGLLELYDELLGPVDNAARRYRRVGN